MKQDKVPKMFISDQRIEARRRRSSQRNNPTTKKERQTIKLSSDHKLDTT